jgi:hypothetical protein
MAVGKPGAEVLESIPVSCAPSEVGNDAQSEWVAANAGEMFTEQVGGSTDVAGGRGADHFNVMAFPAHRAATGGTWRCFGDGGEVGDGEPEAGIGPDRATERRHRVIRVDGLLRSAIEGGGLGVCCHRPTVVLDCGTRRGGLATAGGWLFWIFRHGHHVGFRA